MFLNIFLISKKNKLQVYIIHLMHIYMVLMTQNKSNIVINININVNRFKKLHYEKIHNIKLLLLISLLTLRRIYPTIELFT